MLFLTVVFTFPVDHENVRLTLALAIPTGVPITVANDVIEMQPLVVDKTIIKIITKSNIFAKFLTH